MSTVIIIENLCPLENNLPSVARRRQVYRAGRENTGSRKLLSSCVSRDSINRRCADKRSPRVDARTHERDEFPRTSERARDDDRDGSKSIFGSGLSGGSASSDF